MRQVNFEKVCGESWRLDKMLTPGTCARKVKRYAYAFSKRAFIDLHNQILPDFKKLRVKAAIGIGGCSDNFECYTTRYPPAKQNRPL